MSSLKSMYEGIAKTMASSGSYKSHMQIPKIEKVVLNMRVGEATQDRKHMVVAEKALGDIAGQKAMVCKARKSISSFKIRQGFPIGCKVTLRRKRMWEFLEKLTRVVMPRIRDFRGCSDASFDGHGNFNFGIKEFIVFPEIDMESIDRMRGLDIAIVTTAKTDNQAKELLSGIGFPFNNG